MKLVDILARELEEWPLDCGSCVQDYDREVRFSHGAASDFFAKTLADKCPKIAAEDGIPYAGRVTRAEWQAARDALLALEPESVAWDGEGLPPVEAIVELRSVSAQVHWAKAKIKFASYNVVVWEWVGEPAMNPLCTAYVHSLEIRPLRTAEQIAAEERKAGIRTMMDEIGFSSSVLSNKDCEILWDAGYRKQEAK